MPPSADRFQKKLYVVLLALERMPFKFISGSPPQCAWQWKGGVCPGKRGGMQRNEDGSAQGISYRDWTRGHCRGRGVEARRLISVCWHGLEIRGWYLGDSDG